MLPKIPLRMLPANLLTATNMSLGFTSIALAATEKFTLAAWFILWSVVMDKADGTVAKLMKSQSRFGAEFDSLSDLVSFGIAPAFLLHLYITSSPEPVVSWGVSFAGALIYALATAVRLARFNVQCVPAAQPRTDSTDQPASNRAFVGIPSTLAAAFIASSWLVLQEYGGEAVPHLIYPAALVVAGLLMLSTVKTPKLMRRNHLYNVVQFLVTAIILVCAIFRTLPIIPFLVASLYILVSLAITVIPAKGRA